MSDEKSEKPAGRSVEDRQKEIGRDGAYLEVASSDLVKASKDGSLNDAKMLVITNGRLDISDPAHVACLKQIISEIQPDEIAGMDEAQQGFYAYRKIFETGLHYLTGGLAVGG